MAYEIGGLPPSIPIRLMVWNGAGTGRNLDRGFVTTGADGSVEISVPANAVFALTTTPVMTTP